MFYIISPTNTVSQSELWLLKVPVEEKDVDSGECVAVLLCETLYFSCIAKRKFTIKSNLCNSNSWQNLESRGTQ